MLPSIKVRSSDIHADVLFFLYRIAGNFGRELNLAVWWSELKLPN